MDFSKARKKGRRLKQNHVKLRQTKNSQYHVTLPKGIVEAMGHKKGDVYRVVIEDGSITLMNTSIKNVSMKNTSIKNAAGKAGKK